MIRNEVKRKVPLEEEGGVNGPEVAISVNRGVNSPSSDSFHWNAATPSKKAVTICDSLLRNKNTTAWSKSGGNG